ncbi:penicillin acylase family protein [Marinobacter sp.]|uniref:penicillin acylase family protein n=1 Tax=Marinobacter sp. TaxID=50741 RepID=UPI003A93C32E
MQTWNIRAARVARGAALVLLGSTMLAGCFDSSSSSSSSQPPLDTNLFPADGKLEATIRRTEGGVPHIKADNLMSAAFGHGYAQAQDNVCLLAEAIVKARSERAKYFGPGQGNINIINDFSYKAQDILSGANTEYPQLSSESKALIDGFTAGYNRYVLETLPADLPVECREQPWVKEIEPVDLLAHYRIIGQYASGDRFATGLVYMGVPPVTSSEPVMVGSFVEGQADGLDVAAAARKNLENIDTFAETELASNAWGIGSDLTEGGKGALLANPHFPYTGHRRLYQAHLTVPGYLNINGAGLMGTAIPLINFNDHLAWSHTVSTSRRFTWYELELKPGDPLTYIKNGVEKPITSKTFEIEVNMGGPQPVVMKREFWFSEYGPMLAANLANAAFPAWGGTGLVNKKPAAYTYRDANTNTKKLLETWLGMSRASNLEEFKNVFRNCGSTLWVNSTYADDEGNAFYIDSSSVPYLSEAAEAVVAVKRTDAGYNALFEAGITLLDGSKSRDDWVEGQCGGLVPFDKKPMLQRADWVQNSNSSYWATNPDAFLTGYSQMFGDEEAELNPRTRLGIKMLQNPADPGLDASAKPPAGADGKFSARDLIDTIWNNRAWYAEQFMPELKTRCTAVGATPVNVPQRLLPDAPAVSSPGTQSVVAACGVLSGWNGTYDLTSRGAHLFRAFVDIYRSGFEGDLVTQFDPVDPVNTPADPSTTNLGTADDPMLQSLGAAVVLLNHANIALDSQLGDVQYYQPSGGVVAGGDPTNATALSGRIAWHGGDGNVDGAFNAIGVVNNAYAEDTRIPRVVTPAYVGQVGTSKESWVAAGLSANDGEGWLIARGTSWHFGLEFTEQGPEAYGLLSYSQSTDSDSDFFIDQSQRYSMKDARKLLFTEDEIEANLLPNSTITIRN